ncbi:SET domain-containing protein SmydA-8-like [Anthonomus grandis grandis]|uniref:SET domain-containing protein SmydA-8-like n=1 Tax=Anthonomus grandis grandis TaxID=2921223 RepID=UPI00216660C4|nr:SET domain-containing protein SmydA-8-like [Anthonomus grandis grandis]
MSEVNEEAKCALCQKIANQICSACHNVFYCSKEHQKSHWKKHKEHCQAFKISSDEAMGRFLEASNDIKENIVILKEKPLVIGPAQETIPVCLGCYQEIDSGCYKSCSKCKWPMCSVKCEESVFHAPECFFISRSKSEFLINNFENTNHFYQIIIILRCLYQKKHNPEVWQKITNLESHNEERKSTNKYNQEKLMVTEILYKLLKLESEFSVEEILNICGIILVNSHEVPLSEPPYIAIYEKTSMLEHNCRSNCSKSFSKNGEILITSGLGIKKGDHLSICYADPLWGTMKRRAFLKETKFFSCCCPRCSDATEFQTYFSSFSCQKGSCEGKLLPKSFLQTTENLWRCNKCDYSVENTLVSTLTEKLENEITYLNKNNIFSCKNFLKKLRKILPANNFLLVEVKLALCQLIGQLTANGLADVCDEDLALKRLLCMELIQLTNTLIPSERRVRGLLLFEKHACLVEIATRMAKKYGDVESMAIQKLLQESRSYVKQAIEQLKFEPNILPEGKICAQARKNLEDLNSLLQ